jgi:hypothetical protein
MQRLLTLLFVSTCMSLVAGLSGAETNVATLRYYIEKVDRADKYPPIQNEVRVVEGGQEYIVELDDKITWYEEAVHKHIFATVDLDEDTIPEAIIETHNWGNCCGPTYYVIKRVGPGFYTVIESEHLTGWPSVELMQGTNRTRIQVTNFSEGVGNTSQLETLSELELRDGQLLLVSHFENHAFLKALTDVTAEELLNVDERLITFDVDRDGLIDELRCNYWGRWGAVSCRLDASTIGSVLINGGCNRIGILEEVNAGVHSLVCNRNRVLNSEPAARAFD